MPIQHAYQIARILEIEGYQAFVLHTDHKRGHAKIATNAPRDLTDRVRAVGTL